MAGFVKIDSGIFGSSIMEEAPVTRLVWLFMLASATRTGEVDETHQALARRFNLRPEDVETAIHSLEQPDKISRSQAEEGRRIVRLDDHRDWGWQIVNYELYRNARDADERRAYKTRHTAEKRARDAASAVETVLCPQLSTAVHSCPHVDNVDRRGPMQRQSAEGRSKEERRVPTGLVGVADPTRDESQENPSAEGKELARLKANMQAEITGEIMSKNLDQAKDRLENAKDRTETMLARQRSANARKIEMIWRVQECWAAHLAQRERHWQTVENWARPPGRPPTLTKSRKKLISDCILRLDEGLMGGSVEDRAHWEENSKARGAGVGIFLDTWMTAEQEGNQLGNGGKRYLEPERAWKIVKGVDNAERFAELYFEAKERHNG